MSDKDATKVVAWSSGDAPMVKLDNLSGLGEEDLAKLRDFEVKEIGLLDQMGLESMLVGYLLRDPSAENYEGGSALNDRRNADALAESGLRGSWFECKALGALFDDLLEYYREWHQMASVEEVGEMRLAEGRTRDEAINYQMVLCSCHSAVLSRGIGVEKLVLRARNKHFRRREDDLHRTYVREYSDPRVGPEAALEKFRKAVAGDLSDPRGAVLRAHDWFGDYNANLTGFREIKNDPEKRSGYKCGIAVVDEATEGFRKGHLSVFVGKHGGFKTTMLLNVAYGLWENGYDVLYASLEMPARDVETKLWCRGTRRVSFNKLYKGLMSEPGDWDKRDALAAAKEAGWPGLSPAEIEAAGTNLTRLDLALSGARRGEEDSELIARFYEERQARDNRLMICNVGQSEKVRASQLEGWLKDHEGEFKPHVVIVDYLALVAPETPYPNRPDLEIGESCKYLRSMGEQRGCAIITAAQLKRSALARVRKYGVDNPDKVQFDTDDIEGSNQIGADADDVFVLWKEDGGAALRVFMPKNRYVPSGAAGGIKVQVDPDTCTIGADDLESTERRSAEATPGEINDSIRRMPIEEEPWMADGEDAEPRGTGALFGSLREVVEPGEHDVTEDDALG